MEGLKMAIRLNEDAEMVKRIKEGLKKKGGYLRSIELSKAYSLYRQNKKIC